MNRKFSRGGELTRTLFSKRGTHTPLSPLWNYYRTHEPTLEPTVDGSVAEEYLPEDGMEIDEELKPIDPEMDNPV